MRFARFSLFCLVCCVTLGCAATETAQSAGFFKSNFHMIDTNFWYVSNGWANGDWQSCEWQYSAVGAHNGNVILVLSDHGGTKRPIGCGEIRTKEASGYGLYEARMRSAAGSGLNTAFFTYSKQPWDEIDFEFLGKDPHSVQTNFYTNGKSQGGTTVQLGFDASKEFHNYAIDWQPTKITWYVDGKQVFQSPAGVVVPSHPGSLFFSLWSGGAQENAWMGEFNYTQPVDAEVAWAAYTPPDSKCLFEQSLSCK